MFVRRVEGGELHLPMFVRRVEGGELFDRVIEDDYILTEKACAIFMRQVCAGVNFMHQKNVLHLDMKVTRLVTRSPPPQDGDDGATVPGRSLYKQIPIAYIKTNAYTHACIYIMYVHMANTAGQFTFV